MNKIEILQAMDTEQNPLYWTKKEQDDAIDAAIEAMEKIDIPKQVLKSRCEQCSNDCNGCEEYTDRCSSCKESISNDVGYEYPFCPERGQKLIW